MPLRHPVGVRPDNHLAFINRLSNSKRNRPILFETAGAELGIRHKFIRPYLPCLIGKVERSHREDQKRFYCIGETIYSNSLLVHNRLSNNFPMRPPA